MRHWIEKFRVAFRGIAVGAAGQSSFLVHSTISIAVFSLAFLLGCTLLQWCVLLLCIAIVLTAELANSSVEHLARGLCHDRNEHVGNALDIASGAVLVASIFSAIIGILIFGSRLLQIVGQ